jgi:hypothetical protein
MALTHLPLLRFLAPPCSLLSPFLEPLPPPPAPSLRAGAQDYLIGKRKDRGGKPWQPPPKLVLQWSVELARWEEGGGVSEAGGISVANPPKTGGGGRAH